MSAVTVYDGAFPPNEDFRAMLATLTLMTALSLTPGQAGDLQLTNERVTYGMLGPVRTDKTFLPGDVYFLHYEIEGLANKEGQVRYSMKMELVDGKGKTKFSSDTDERTIFNVFGGNRVPGFAYATIGLDAEPGEYTFKITVTDLVNKKAQAMVRKFEVGKRDFGVVAVKLTYDGRLPAPPAGVVGQALVLDFGIAGFERDKNKQPHVGLELRVTDDAGKLTLPKPISDEISKVEEKSSILPGAFDLALTRPGKFTVELKATDLLTKKTASVTLPIIVYDPQK